MLLDLIEEHRPAFEYDWRARFHLGLGECPDVMGWGEAYRLTVVLASDSASRVGAAVAGWEYPASREALIAADQYDLSARIASGRRKPRPYPRPWPDDSKRKFGAGSTRDKAEMRALLDSQRNAKPIRPRDSKGRFVKASQPGQELSLLPVELVV